MLLANSDALKCRLACRLFEGTRALKPPLQAPQFCGGEMGSPTVSLHFWYAAIDGFTNRKVKASDSSQNPSRNQRFKTSVTY
jgi:hypothetical protein